MIELVPKNATVSATYNVVPHLTDRLTIFQSPNPFKRHYWALSNKGPYTDVKYVDYVLLDTRRDKDYDDFERLKSDGKYVASQTKGPFILYKYVEHEDPRNEEAFRTSKQVTLKAKDTSNMELPEDFYSGGELTDDKLLSEDLTLSIATGVSNHIIYVDAHIGAMPSGLAVLKRGKNKVRIYTSGFMENRNHLFNSGLLVMQYATHALINKLELFTGNKAFGN